MCIRDRPGTVAPGGVVFSDVRFINEVDAIRAAGGMVWKIERPEAGLAGTAGQHASEKEQESIPKEHFRFTLYNRTTLPGLEAMVRELVDVLKTGA